MAYDGPKIKALTCMFVLYPESQQSIIEYAQKNLPCAWALHDKDVYTLEDAEHWAKYNKDEPFPHQVGELKKPHYHFVCKFPHPRYFHAIAKELGVSQNAINKCNDLLGAYEYLWHEGREDKYQYDKSIVGTHEFQEPTSETGVDDELTEVGKLLNMPPFKTTAECARWAYANGCWSSFRKGYSIWRDIRMEMRDADPALNYVCNYGHPASPDHMDGHRAIANSQPNPPFGD